MGRQSGGNGKPLNRRVLEVYGTSKYKQRLTKQGPLFICANLFSSLRALDSEKSNSDACINDYISQFYRPQKLAII